MKIYSSINDELIELKEVSFLIENTDDLIKLKEFVDYCISGAKNNVDFSHEHFGDFLDSRKYTLGEQPEIIVCK